MVLLPRCRLAAAPPSRTTHLVLNACAAPSPPPLCAAVRVPDGQRLLSKQLTLCYCDSTEEAAVARDLATVWSWHQVNKAAGAAGEHSTAPRPRLNFPMAR